MLFLFWLFFFFSFFALLFLKAKIWTDGNLLPLLLRMKIAIEWYTQHNKFENLVYFFVFRIVKEQSKVEEKFFPRRASIHLQRSIKHLTKKMKFLLLYSFDESGDVFTHELRYRFLLLLRDEKNVSFMALIVLKGEHFSHKLISLGCNHWLRIFLNKKFFHLENEEHPDPHLQESANLLWKWIEIEKVKKKWEKSVDEIS